MVAVLAVIELDLNQTLNPALQPTGQTWWYLAIGTILGAALTGILNILRDWWNRERDREDDRNEL
jgi:4-hydroxybenzoate polyprenyltransferase